MIVVRAFPEHPPEGRPHVVDGWPRVPVDNYDYSYLAEVGDDVISMDWDTAASRSQVLTLARHAAAEPDKVLVAPCLNYRPAEGVWNVGTVDRAGVFTRLEAPDEGEWADHFGFGMVYLPRFLILAYIATNPGQRMTDVWFSDWHHRCGLRARIDWSVRPVHLHYPEAESGRL